MQQRRKVIGVSMLTLDAAFYRALKAGLEESAQEAGYDLIFSVEEYGAGGQTVQIAGFAAKKNVDAIVVTPCHSASVGMAIELANRAGIPVFTLDIANTSGLGEVVSHIASDNVRGGRKAGELMAKALGGQGSIIIVIHPGVTSVLDRVRGFKEEVSSIKGLSILGEFPVWNDPRRECASLVAKMLARSALDGIFCINDEFALGAVAAVEAAGKAGKVVIVGYDATEEGRHAIQQGRIYGDVVQHPADLAALTIGAIRDHFAAKPVPPLILAEVGTYTAAEARGRFD